MDFSLGIIVLVTLAEMALVGAIFVFFLRLKRSESALLQLQDAQQKVLDRMQNNALLEQELVDSFAMRQEQLIALNTRLDERILSIKKLLEQAEGISRSPHFLREVILNGRRKGQSAPEIAKGAGLSVDEVELILSQQDYRN